MASKQAPNPGQEVLLLGRDQSNQDRGSDLSDDDRSVGGQTSAKEQDRDEQGQFSGMGGSQGGSHQGGSQDRDRDDQGQFTSDRGGSQGGNR